MSWILWSLAGAAEPPSVVDLQSLQYVGNVRLSPDDTTVAFVASGWSYDPEADPEGETHGGWTETSALYRMDADGGVPERLTWTDDGPWGVQWSPDGRHLLFQREVDGKRRVQLLALDGGEPRTLDLGGLRAHSLRFSPDGRDLRFLAAPKWTDDEKAERFRTGKVERFEQSARMHRLYTVSLDGGTPEALTDGSFHVMGFEESHAGGTFALTTSTLNNAYETVAHPGLKLLTDAVSEVDEAHTCVESVAFSPDDAHLAWIGCETGGITDALWVRDVQSGASTNVLADADPTLNDLVWTPDSKAVVAVVSVKTEHALWRVPAGGGAPKVLAFDDGVVRSVAMIGKGKEVLAVVGDSRSPQRLVRLNLKNGRSEVLYDPNPQIADWALSPAEVVSWTGPEGTALEGVFYPGRPAEGATRPTPLLVIPHGGPDSVSTVRFDGWAQFFAGQGYAVLKPNYRGGLAYGRDFYAANRGRLGEIEFMDIESGVDSLIESGRVDAEQLYYGGWSWGGYLTAWTIGHTERYRAAMAGAAVVDTIAQYVGSDINHGTIADWEFEGRPWKAFETFDASNPRRSLHEVTTPTLILHGKNDRRVPFDQGVTLYRALSDSGVETEFYAYPGEGHGLGAPEHRVHRLETWLDWLKSHAP